MATKGVELASAYISLNVSTDGVPRQIRNALEGVKDIDVDVDAKTSGATANMSRWRSGEESRPVNVKVDVDTRRARRKVGVLRRDMEGLVRSDLLKINLGAAGISALPALASGLAEVAAALQQVSQAAFVVPGAIAGAVGSVGTLALGLSGVGDAYDALSKASDDAATSGGDVASSTRAQLSASNSLRNAVVDEAQARKDVARATRDAKNELMDLNIEMRGGVLSEKRAVLEAQKARERLLSGDFTDVREALLSVEEADQRVIETRARNAQTQEELADANAKGVAGSDQVVDANERLIRSQQGVAEAQAGVAASAPKASAAQEKAALALSKLHPEVRQLVETTHAFVNGPGMELRNLLGGNIAAGLSDKLTGLANRVMPTLEKRLGEVSSAWNDNFAELAQVLGSDQNVSLLDRILGNTAEAQSLLTKVIDPLIEGVGVLTAAGSDSLPRMVEALAGASERFADFISEADADGSLARWIDEGLTGLGHLGNTALNVGKMFTAITNAAGPKDLLANIERLTFRWQEFLNSTEGQQTLRDIFAQGKEVFEQWRPILEDLPGLFKGLFDAATTYMGALLPVLDELTTFLADHPGLVEAAALAFAAFSGPVVLGAIAVLSRALTGISDLLGKPGKGGIGILGKLGWLATGGFLAYEVASGATRKFHEDADRQFAENHTNFQQTHPYQQPTVGGQSVGTELMDKIRAGQLPGYSINSSGQIVDPNGKIVPINPASLQDSPTVKPGESARDSGNPLGTLLGPPTQTRGPNAAPTLPDFLRLPDFLGLGGGSMGPGGKPIPGTSMTQPTYGLPADTDSGGYGNGGDEFPAWVHALGEAFGVKPSTYPRHQTGNRNEPGYAPNPQGLNRGIDWAGPVENMQRFADYLSTVPGALEQVIWQNPSTGSATEIAGGKPQPGYFSATLGGHKNHVHTRQSMPIPLPPWMTFDEGGWLPPGMTLANNQTGKPELILTPEQVAQMGQMGVDPNTVLHGQGAGQQPGLSPEQMQNLQLGAQAIGAGVDPGIEQQFGFGSQRGDQEGVNPLAEVAGGTEGFIPSGAGSTSVAGTSFVAGVLNLGNEAVAGLIEMGAQLAKMGVSAAITGAAGAGSFGAAAAAGPAASAAAGIGIDIAAAVGKRAAAYGFQMASIGADALIEQFFPIGGPPRWLGYDYTQLAPNLNIQGSMAAAGEAIGNSLFGQQGQQPGAPMAPVDPLAAQHGTGMGQPPGPGSASAAAVQPIPAPPTNPFGTETAAPPQHQPGAAPQPTTPPINPTDPTTWGIFDTGGVLQPNAGAVNLSSRPEYVFTQSQFKAMEATASQGGGGDTYYQVYGSSLDEAMRELKKHERRASRPQMSGKAGL